MLLRSKQAPLHIEYEDRISKTPGDELIVALREAMRIKTCNLAMTVAFLRNLLPYGFHHSAPILEWLSLELLDGPEKVPFNLHCRVTGQTPPALSRRLGLVRTHSEFLRRDHGPRPGWAGG